MSNVVDINTENIEYLESVCSSVESNNNLNNNVQVPKTLDFSPEQKINKEESIFENSPVFKENARNEANVAKFEMFSSSKEGFENCGSEVLDSVYTCSKPEETFEAYGTGVVHAFNGNQECIIQQQDVKEGLKKFFETCLPDEDGFVSKEDIVIKFEDKFKDFIPKNYLDAVKETVMVSAADAINFEAFYQALKYWIENILMNRACSFSSPDRHDLNFKIVDTPVSNEDSDFEDFLTDSCYKPFCIVGDDPTRRSTLQSTKIVQRIDSNDYPLPSPIREPEYENSDNERPNRTNRPDIEENFDFTVGSIETDSNITPLDPVELKDEVNELTFANQRLMREREILSAQNTQADLAQVVLRKKCENLENSLSMAQMQMGRLRNVEEENQKLKIEIAEQIQLNTELKSTLTSSQDSYETLLKKFDFLKEEAEVVSEKLERAIQEKENLSLRITECLNEANKVTECNGTLFEKLNFKDLKIEHLSKRVMCLEDEIEKLQSENCNLMGELHQLKDYNRLPDIHEEFRTKLAMANGSLFEEDDYSGGERSNDSRYSSQSPSPSETKEKEATSPVNIRDEICSLDMNYVGTALPFCEKDESSSSSRSSQTSLISLKKSLSKWMHWKRKTLSMAEDLQSSGSLDDEAQSLLEGHKDELVSLTKKWRSFLNLRIECEISPCKKVILPDRFSLTSWSSLELENQRDDAAVSKYADEDQIVEQCTLITVSDPSKDFTEKDSKIEELLSPSSRKESPLSRIEDVFNETLNFSTTVVREKRTVRQIVQNNQDFCIKCCGKDDKTTTLPPLPLDDEAVVSSSTKSSIFYHDLPVTSNETKIPKTPEETKFLSSDIRRSYSHESQRSRDEAEIASRRSRKVVLIVVGILSAILSVCSILSYVLRNEAHKSCFNNPHLIGHGSWMPIFQFKYTGEPPY